MDLQCPIKAVTINQSINQLLYPAPHQPAPACPCPPAPVLLQVTVTYAPTDASESSERLQFAVSRGRPCTLSVSGVGSHMEAEEHQEKLYRI